MKTEELIEDYLVYTDNGIEKVHWCEVNGVKELVSPKGKVYGYVPDYFENKRLQEQLDELQNENNNLCNDIVDLNLTIENKEKQLDEANDTILGMIGAGSYQSDEMGNLYLKKWGVK